MDLLKVVMEKKMNNRDESRKRKQREEEVDLEAWNLKLAACYSERNGTNFNNVLKFDNVCNKKQKKSEFEYMEDTRVAKTLKRFSVYTSQEEKLEKSFGVSTKLKLCVNGDDTDPWKIKKVLKKSDCNHLYRLILGKDMVENHIIKIWEDAGKRDEMARISDDNGVVVKVWDYQREKEFDLNFKKLTSSRSYILRGAWHNKFVKERGLKEGDTIGLYWSEFKSRFVFSVLARALVAAAAAAEF